MNYSGFLPKRWPRGSGPAGVTTNPARSAVRPASSASKYDRARPCHRSCRPANSSYACRRGHPSGSSSARKVRVEERELPPRMDEHTTMCVGMFVFLVKYHGQFSAGPVLEQAVRISSDTTRVFAVPTSSPAASFAFQKVVPTLTLESLASLTPPTESERILLIVPPRQVDAVKRAIPGGTDELQHSEMVVLIWTMK